VKTPPTRTKPGRIFFSLSLSPFALAALTGGSTIRHALGSSIFILPFPLLHLVRVDAALVAFAAVAAVTLLLSLYARAQAGYAAGYDCYRLTASEAVKAAQYVDNPDAYTSTRFRATFYYSNGTVVVRGAAPPRAQCHAYHLASTTRGELALVKVEG